MIWAMEYRDETDDQRPPIDAANAIGNMVSVSSCPTITPDEDRVEEFGLRKVALSKMHHSEHSGCVVFREPIICGKRTASWCQAGHSLW